MKNFKSLSKSAFRALTALVFVAAVSTALFAAAPAQINYQGKLTDSSGIPFNGTKNVTFSFWDNATVGAGSQIGSDVTVNNVSVVNGVFNAVIDVSGIAFVSNPNVYLQIRIDGSNFGPTRQKLVAAPYSLAVAAGAVSGGAGGTITDGTIDANDLAAGAVTSAKIADGTIAAADLAADSVTSAKIVDGTIVAGDLAIGAVVVSGGLAGSITDGTIDANDLAASAVTSAKILDGTIATGDLANNAIDGNKLAGNAVTSAKIQDGTIVNADFSATPADALAASKVKGGTFASGTAFVFPDQVTMQGDLVVGSGGTALAKYLSAIRNYDVPNLTADASDSFTITVTGAAVGDGVVVTPPGGWAASLFLNAYVSAANTVTVTAYNAGSGPQNPGPGDFRAMVFQH